MSGHMADAGGEVVAANGYGTRIMMIDKDARRMDVVTPPTMTAHCTTLHGLVNSKSVGQ